MGPFGRCRVFERFCSRWFVKRNRFSYVFDSFLKLLRSWWIHTANESFSHCRPYERYGQYGLSNVPTIKNNAKESISYFQRKKDFCARGVRTAASPQEGQLMKDNDVMSIFRCSAHSPLIFDFGHVGRIQRCRRRGHGLRRFRRVFAWPHPFLTVLRTLCCPASGMLSFETNPAARPNPEVFNF
jgi:hypothetical protein